MTDFTNSLISTHDREWRAFVYRVEDMERTERLAGRMSVARMHVFALVKDMAWEHIRKNESRNRVRARGLTPDTPRQDGVYPLVFVSA
jgi:hypothetical protein